MAVTQNTYTGDGTTVLFSFTFPYLETTDIKVSLNGTITTAYTLANATTIQFNTAPANGVAIRIYRVTDDAALAAQFYPGSAIRSADLNENFTQNLYVTQESSRDATASLTTASSAATTANTALTAANNAISASTTATANALSAISTSASAVVTANLARNDALYAVTTADAAEDVAQDALDLVASVVPYTTIANVAAIPPTGTTGEVVEILNSTGIENYGNLSGLPVGFVGDPGIRVKISYSQTGVVWNYLLYSPNDPDNRYIPTSDLGLTVQGYDANTVKSNQQQTFTAVQTFALGQVYPQIPQNSQTSAYTLVASDAGKHISITTGGVTVNNVFSVGDVVSIYNNSGSLQVLTQGAGVTLRLAATSNTGNRNLVAYGLCTLLCVGAGSFVVSGAGVS